MRGCECLALRPEPFANKKHFSMSNTHINHKLAFSPDLSQSWNEPFSGTFPDQQGSALYQIFHNTERTSGINSMMQFDWIPLQVILCGHQWPLDENADSRTKGKDREKSRMGVLTLLFLLRGQQQGRERGNEWMNNGAAQIMWGHVSFSLSCLSVWPEKQRLFHFMPKIQYRFLLTGDGIFILNKFYITAIVSCFSYLC